MKVKGICYFVLSQYSVLVGLNIHAVNRPQGAYYLYPFEDPCSTLFCNNVYWCRLVWSGNVCGIQTMNELYSALWMKQLLLKSTYKLICFLLPPGGVNNNYIVT